MKGLKGVESQGGQPDVQFVVGRPAFLLDDALIDQPCHGLGHGPLGHPEASGEARRIAPGVVGDRLHEVDLGGMELHLPVEKDEAPLYGDEGATQALDLLQELLIDASHG